MALIGFCGDDCEQCPRYTATQNNDREALKAAAVLWYKVGLRDDVASPEDMICDGCSKLDSCHYNDIRECAQEKKISNCGECDMYPCEKMRLVFERTAVYSRQCKETCNTKDYNRLHAAFFSKKERLDAIYQAHIIT